MNLLIADTRKDVGRGHQSRISALHHALGGHIVEMDDTSVCGIRLDGELICEGLEYALIRPEVVKLRPEKPKLRRHSASHDHYIEEWQKHGLAEPEAVIRATLAYRESEDVFSRFMADTNLVFDPNLEIQAARLQELLSDWAQEEGIDPSGRELGEWLRENGGRKKQRRVAEPDGTIKRPKFWVGIGFLDEKQVAEQVDVLA